MFKGLKQLRKRSAVFQVLMEAIEHRCHVTVIDDHFVSVYADPNSDSILDTVPVSRSVTGDYANSANAAAGGYGDDRSASIDGGGQSTGAQARSEYRDDDVDLYTFANGSSDTGSSAVSQYSSLATVHLDSLDNLLGTTYVSGIGQGKGQSGSQASRSYFASGRNSDIYGLASGDELNAGSYAIYEGQIDETSGQIEATSDVSANRKASTYISGDGTSVDGSHVHVASAGQVMEATNYASVIVDSVYSTSGSSTLDFASLAHADTNLAGETSEYSQSDIDTSTNLYSHLERPDGIDNSEGHYSVNATGATDQATVTVYGDMQNTNGTSWAKANKRGTPGAIPRGEAHFDFSVPDVASGVVRSAEGSASSTAGEDMLWHSVNASGGGGGNTSASAAEEDSASNFSSEGAIGVGLAHQQEAGFDGGAYGELRTSGGDTGWGIGGSSLLLQSSDVLSEDLSGTSSSNSTSELGHVSNNTGTQLPNGGWASSDTSAGSSIGLRTGRGSAIAGNSSEIVSVSSGGSGAATVDSNDVNGLIVKTNGQAASALETTAESSSASQEVTQSVMGPGGDSRSASVAGNLQFLNTDPANQYDNWENSRLRFATPVGGSFDIAFAGLSADVSGGDTASTAYFALTISADSDADGSPDTTLASASVSLDVVNDSGGVHWEMTSPTSDFSTWSFASNHLELAGTTFNLDTMDPDAKLFVDFVHQVHLRTTGSGSTSTGSAAYEMSLDVTPA